MASEKTILLTQLDPTGLDGGKKRENRERKERGKIKENYRVRSSHSSLDFPTIGPVASSETRGKVDPHCKSYTWVPILWSFEKSGR